jgi:arginyl-tRNA synthetase
MRIAEAISIALDINLTHQEIAVKPHFSKQSESDSCKNYHYSSTIAYSLTHRTLHKIGRSPLKLAQMLYEPISTALADRFQVEISGDGWLNFKLTDCLMAESLVALFQSTADYCSGSTSVPALDQSGRSREDCPDWYFIYEKSPNFPGYTNVQYAHARCCSLLRLVRQQELTSDLHICNWKLLDPEGVLYLHTSTEQRLALCLLAIADEMHHDSAQSKELDRKVAIKLGKNLAANFLDFYDACRIVNVGRDLGLARIGLVATTKNAIAYLVAGLILLPESL